MYTRCSDNGSQHCYLLRFDGLKQSIPVTKVLALLKYEKVMLIIMQIYTRQVSLLMCQAEKTHSSNTNIALPNFGQLIS